MTVYQLLKDLAEEIEAVLADMIFKDPKGKMEHMRAFPQALPKREQNVKIGDLLPDEGEDDEDPYPYCVVRAESGNMGVGAQKVKILLIFGIFDDDIQNQGQTELLNVIHRVTERFIKNPVLKDRYRLDLDAGMYWILDDEDRFPYFAGGVGMTWDTFFVEKEDDYV